MAVYGLIGRRLGHSYSAQFFNSHFRATGSSDVYKLFELSEISELPQLVATEPGLRGLNVTVPYKEAVIPYLDALADSASGVGAVNCIEFRGDEETGRVRLIGHNTDVAGFRKMIEPLLPSLQHRRALVFGTGGASKGVCSVLREAHIWPLTVARRKGKGDMLYEEITPQALKEAALLVNATPLGMWPDTEGVVPIDFGMLTAHQICIDLVYNPGVTEFMKRAAEQGCFVKNGLEMLMTQAVEAAYIWGLEGFGQ